MNTSKSVFYIALILLFLLPIQLVDAGSISEKEEKYLLENITDIKAKIPMNLVHKALYSDNAMIRNRAIFYLGRNGNNDSIIYLIDFLLEKNTNNQARKALKRITGEDFGFNWRASDEAKIATITKWNKWIKERDLAIQEAMVFIKKKQINLFGYTIYKANYIDLEKTIWEITFIADSPTVNSSLEQKPKIILNTETSEMTFTPGE